MQVNESENGMLFVLSNKDLKAIKRSHRPVGYNVAKEGENKYFSFMSEEAFNKQQRAFIEREKKKAMQQKMAENMAKIPEDEGVAKKDETVEGV